MLSCVGNIRQYIGFALLAVVACCWFAGCGGSEPDVSESEVEQAPPPEERKIELPGREEGIRSAH